MVIAIETESRGDAQVVGFSQQNFAPAHFAAQIMGAGNSRILARNGGGVFEDPLALHGELSLRGARATRDCGE